MKIYSKMPQWMRASHFTLGSYYTLYTICIKRLFRKPKIIGTNISIKEGTHLVDLTVRRYGIPDCESIFVFMPAYVYESEIYGFPDIDSLCDAYQSGELGKMTKGLQFYKNKTIDLRYELAHLQVAQIKVPAMEYVVEGYYVSRRAYPMGLTKGGKVVKIKDLPKILSDED